MGNIIVGIDFSKNSINSLKHAVAIALKTSDTLHLVWVKTAGVTKGLAKENKHDFAQMANDKLQYFMEECKKEAPKVAAPKAAPAAPKPAASKPAPKASAKK